MSMTLLSDSDNLSLKMNNPQRYAWHSYQLATPCSSDVALRPASMTNRIQLHWCHFVVDFKRVRIRIHGRLSVRSFKPLSKNAPTESATFFWASCAQVRFSPCYASYTCVRASSDPSPRGDVTVLTGPGEGSEGRFETPLAAGAARQAYRLTKALWARATAQPLAAELGEVTPNCKWLMRRQRRTDELQRAIDGHWTVETDDGRNLCRW